MTRPRKNPSTSAIRSRIFRSRGVCLTTRPTKRHQHVCTRGNMNHEQQRAARGCEGSNPQMITKCHTPAWKLKLLLRLNQHCTTYNWVEPPGRYHLPSKVSWQFYIGSGKSQEPIVPANCAPPTVAPMPVNGWLATYWSRSRSRQTEES